LKEAPLDNNIKAMARCLRGQLFSSRTTLQDHYCPQISSDSLKRALSEHGVQCHAAFGLRRFEVKRISFVAIRCRNG
jgi:hypothetical protein